MGGGEGVGRVGFNINRHVFCTLGAQGTLGPFIIPKFIHPFKKKNHIYSARKQAGKGGIHNNPTYSARFVPREPWTCKSVFCTGARQKSEPSVEFALHSA
jgi:hypothetical protein